MRCKKCTRQIDETDTRQRQTGVCEDCLNEEGQIIVINRRQFGLMHSFIHSMHGTLPKQTITTFLGLCLCPSCPDAGTCSARESIMEEAEKFEDLAISALELMTRPRNGGGPAET